MICPRCASPYCAPLPYLKKRRDRPKRWKCMRCWHVWDVPR